MAHVAELDQDNKVIRVIVIHNGYEPNVEAWATEWAGGGIWKQTSFNATIRKNFAGINYTYNVTLDAFVPPKCHDGATLDETKCIWICKSKSHYGN